MNLLRLAKYFFMPFLLLLLSFFEHRACVIYRTLCLIFFRVICSNDITTKTPHVLQYFKTTHFRKRLVIIYFDEQRVGKHEHDESFFTLLCTRAFSSRGV